jgi:hypothetical protein
MQLLSSRVDNCVQFVEKTTTDPNYVDIIPHETSCHSYVLVLNLKSGKQVFELNLIVLLFKSLAMYKWELKPLLSKPNVRKTRAV